MEHKFYKDQLNRNIELRDFPKRIISLVPSQTELLYHLGLDEQIVGQTKFCLHPANKHKTKPIVGGTKNINLELIASLKPDLIIGNKEENDQKQIEYLMQHYTVWISDIYNLNDACNMISSLGEITNTIGLAEQTVYQIKLEFEQLKKYIPNFETPQKCAYFIWKDPYMVAGNNTFIDFILKYLNFENVFSNHNERYPSVEKSDLIEKNPEIIFLSSEPYPFQEKHLNEINNILPNCKVLLVDGEMFSWYGSRLRHSSLYFKNLLSVMLK